MPREGRRPRRRCRQWCLLLLQQVQCRALRAGGPERVHSLPPHPRCYCDNSFLTTRGGSRWPQRGLREWWQATWGRVGKKCLWQTPQLLLADSRVWRAAPGEGPCPPPRQPPGEAVCSASEGLTAASPEVTPSWVRRYVLPETVKNKGCWRRIRGTVEDQSENWKAALNSHFVKGKI